MCAASAQRVGGAFAAISIGLTFSISVLLKRSATPFCSGVYGVEKDCLMSQLEHIPLNVELVYSDPLSEWIWSGERPRAFIVVRTVIKAEYKSDLFFSGTR